MLACTLQLKPTKEKAVEFRDEFNKILTLIEQLHESNEYSGSPQSLFALVETCADQRPDKSVRQLLDYRAQSIYPCMSWIFIQIHYIFPDAADWLGSLIALFNRYYKNDQR
jgi:Asp-tRNA(Asn)/Glu-tRNA(Gln) amidotransferase C subunit